MNGSRILVIYKRSTYQRFSSRNSARLQELIDSDDESVKNLQAEHEIHQQTLSFAKKLLKNLGAHAVFRYRMEPQPSGAWDLIVTLGGDGTLLWASHLAGSNTPMVAINSAPESSIGYFCAGDRTALEEILRAALVGELSKTRLNRMQVDVNETTVSTRVLNDMLFAHECPAATTRYILRVGEVSEVQLSSGVWVGPAAGSTAAIHSAGGKILALRSKKLQYVIREPYIIPEKPNQLTKGVMGSDETFSIQSQMTQGRIYLDGAQKTHAIELGDTIRVQLSPEPLLLLGLRAQHDR